MSHEIFEYIKAVATVIAAISLYLGYRQLRANVRWNRINATFSYLPAALVIEREHAVAAALKLVDIDFYKQQEPLAPEVVQKILADSNVFREVKDLLNLFEDYATAYKAGAIDPDYSYILSASQFIKYHTVFSPLIKALRFERKNDMYWIEFEKLVLDQWQIRLNDEIRKAALLREEGRKGATYP